MQRTQRRLLCSTNSVSSPSDCTGRPRRRRTSSAGGDCSAVSEDIKKFNDPSAKSRSIKHHTRLGASRRATSRAGKFVKPGFRSFQNTIVLAPFHTLKKCFQSKLIDLYSHEKVKKVNHKKKMAKNTSFEYEVIEFKSLDQDFQKEETTGKCGQREKHEKKKRSRSQSYCQCRKSKPETGHKSSKETRELRTRSSLRRKLSSPDFSPLSKKRTRLSNHPLTQTALKTEPSETSMSKDQIYGRRSDLSASGLSSRSKAESWETFSDSQSRREERMEGSLAISTTSFDSCLEQTERFSDNRRSEHNSRLKLVKRKSRDTLKSKPGATRHLIPMKSSDGQITDFMDREPRTQVVSPVETTRHLHPLKRQSRTKVKQQNASATPKTYHLRSSVSREPIGAMGVRETRQPQPSESNRNQGFLAKESDTNVCIEVGTQVEGNIGLGDATAPETSTNVMLLQSVSDSISLPPVPLETLEKSPDRSKKPAEPSPEPEITCKQQSNTVMSENEGTKSKAAEQDGWNGEIIEPCVLVNEHPDLPSPERIPGSSNQKPEDKEQNFIFGSRNATTRLGESCEFSFGLNWVLSDDEDSDHTDQYC